jgi:hypothetical protein
MLRAVAATAAQARAAQVQLVSVSSGNALIDAANK